MITFHDPLLLSAQCLSHLPFKYVCIQITPQLGDSCRLNIAPLLCRFRDKIKIWNKLWLSLAGKVNLVKMFFMPQLLYFLHNMPIVIPLSIFQEMNSIFRHLLWHNKTPRLRFEYLQRPKDAGVLAMPNPWLYYLVAQLQHLWKGLVLTSAGLSWPNLDSSLYFLLHTSEVPNLPAGLEAEIFVKSKCPLPTYTLIQKVWNKSKQLQRVIGFSPIWHNNHYPELAKLQQAPRWRKWGITHLYYSF